jgi:hypothetical protein
MKPDEAMLVEVYHGSTMNAEMVKTFLEEHGIMATIRNKFMGTIAPWQVTPGGHEPAKVEVLENQKEEALKIIAEFNAAE